MSNKVIGNLSYREMLFYKEALYVCMYVCRQCMNVSMYCIVLYLTIYQMIEEDGGRWQKMDEE